MSPYSLHERDSIDAIKADNLELTTHPCSSYFDFFPIPLLVLNYKRQIVMSNAAFMQMIGAKSFESCLGKRPGEIVGCIYADTGPNGCGTSDHCQACGALLAVLDSISNDAKSTHECQLLIKTPNDQGVAMDLRVTASPWKTEFGNYYVVVLQDIGNEKRRQVLERIFFHDILNSAGGAQSLVDLLLDEVPEVSKQIVELARSSLFALVDEIQKQKQLLAVERNEYTKTMLTLQGIEVINNIAKEFRQHPKCIGKNLIVATDSENIQIITDYTLLRRILVNMVVNALEATCAGGDVTIGLQKHEEFAKFWVHNKEVIPEFNSLQIFKRSFSTKGADRGLGTYSIKLLAENYLGASVGFSSSEDSGTCFWLNLKTSH